MWQYNIWRYISGAKTEFEKGHCSLCGSLLTCMDLGLDTRGVCSIHLAISVAIAHGTRVI